MKLLKRTLFILVISILLVKTFDLFAPKRRERTAMAVFQRARPQSIDVLGIGSSHLYCTLCPAVLYRSIGVSSYLLCTPQQPLEASFEYARRALERNSCKVVILESLMLIRDATPIQVDEGHAHMALDPLPFDIGKAFTAFSMRKEGRVEDYLIPFIKYHSRWRELSIKDFDGEWEPNLIFACRGYALLGKSTPNKRIAEVHCLDYSPLPLNDYYIMWLEKINELAKAFGAQLLLLAAPMPMEEPVRRRCSFLRQYADEHGIKYLDMNCEFNSLNIDVKTDFFDVDHLNVFGAEKATRRIGKYLLENFKFEIDKSPERTTEWKNICERYDYYKAKLTKNAVGDKSTK